MNSVALALLLSAAAVAQEVEKKDVMCTFPILKAIVDEIGGDAFQATALSKPDQDPHSVSPTPALMKRLREADLLVELGLQLDVWAEEIANGSGNPKVMRGGSGRVVASTGIPREDVPKIVSRAEGDLHPEGNPHIWLDPLRVKAMAENVAAALKKAAPERAAAIDGRLRSFQERVDAALFGPELVKEAGARVLARKLQDGTLLPWLEERKLSGKLGGWLLKARPLRGRKVVEYHRAWIYFAKVFGFEIVGSIQPKPGIEPGPRDLSSLEELMKRQEVRLIILENFYNAAYADALSERTGATALVLPAQPGGERGTETYFAFMDYVVERMAGAVK